MSNKNKHSHSFIGQTIQGQSGQIAVSNGYGAYGWVDPPADIEKRMLEISIDNIELNKRIDNLEKMVVKLVAGQKDDK